MCLQEPEFTADSVYMEGSSGYSNGLDGVTGTPEIIIQPPGAADTDVDSKFEVPAAVKLENFSDDYNEIKEPDTVGKEEFGMFCSFYICGI